MRTLQAATQAMQWTLFGRMALAAVFGGLIGLEREVRGKRAGERTFALVAFGSAGFTAVGVELFPASAEKVIAGIATGIGFLGVGIIWRMEGGQARGLTTAAATWAIAAIGVIVGTGLYLTAALATAFTLAVLEVQYVPVVARLVKRLPKMDESDGGSDPSAPGPTREG